MSTVKLTLSVLLCVTTIITLTIATTTGTTKTTFASGVNVIDVNNTYFTKNVTNVKELHLIGLFPHSGLWRGGESIQTAIQLAMDQVNSMDAIPGYRLRMTAYDTKCDPGLAIKAMFEQLYSPPAKLMIIGAGCSIVSEATALASHLWNLVQVSYASVSPRLSDKSEFPLFARLNPPDQFSNSARVKLLRHFGWNRIATIHQSYPIFGKAIEDLLKSLDQEGFRIIRSEVFSDDPSQPIRRLQNDDCRIIFASSYQDMAKTILCEAYKAGLYGPKIVWIFVGWFEPYWWKAGNLSKECSQKELDETIEGSFDVGIVTIHPHPVPSVSGWCPSDFEREYRKAVNNRELPMDNLAPFGYDSVWAIALALNNTRKILQDKGSSKGLEDFTYNDSEIGNLLYSSLLSLTFMGVRGPTRFDKNGDPAGLIKIGRVQGGVKQIVAYYDKVSTNDSQLQWTKDTIIWKGGHPPRDGVEKRTVYVTLSVPLYVSMCVISTLGILLAGGFLAFNILLRHVRLVKMSSPRLNNVILIGCLCTYSTIFIQEHGAGHGTLGCEINTALIVLGTSMAFGALFAKTWRVHIIFSNTFRKLPMKVLTDVRLLGMVLLLIMVDMCVLVTWWLVDSRVLKTRDVETTKEEDIGDVEVTYKEQYCESDHQEIFLGILYAIHVLLLLWGTLLAFETRNVHYPELNDSKYIGMCIYNVTLMVIPGVVLDVALKSGINLMYGLNAALILFGTTVTQCLIFVPKVVSYYVKQATDEGIEGSESHRISGTSVCDGGTSSTRSNVAGGASNPSVSPTALPSEQLDQTAL